MPLWSPAISIFCIHPESKYFSPPHCLHGDLSHYQLLPGSLLKPPSWIPCSFSCYYWLDISLRSCDSSALNPAKSKVFTMTHKATQHLPTCPLWPPLLPICLSIAILTVLFFSNIPAYYYLMALYFLFPPTGRLFLQMSSWFVLLIPPGLCLNVSPFQWGIPEIPCLKQHPAQQGTLYSFPDSIFLYHIYHHLSDTLYILHMYFVQCPLALMELLLSWEKDNEKMIIKIDDTKLYGKKW